MLQRSLAAILILCIACSGLSGCASKYGAPTTEVKHYHTCYAPIQRLRDEEHRVTRTVAVSATLTGAVIFTLCLARGGDAIRCSILAAAGAAGAGTAAYFLAVQNQNKNQNARMAQYLQDLNGDISGLNIATASARMAIQCYWEQFEILVAQYRERGLTGVQLRKQVEASESYKEISSGIDEAQHILGKVIVSAEKSDKMYQEAIAQETKQQQQGQDSQPSVAQPPKEIDKVKAAQVNYKTSIEDAEKASRELKEFRGKMAAHMEV